MCCGRRRDTRTGANTECELLFVACAAFAPTGRKLKHSVQTHQHLSVSPEPAVSQQSGNPGCKRVCTGGYCIWTLVQCPLLRRLRLGRVRERIVRKVRCGLELGPSSPEQMRACQSASRKWRNTNWTWQRIRLYKQDRPSFGQYQGPKAGRFNTDSVLSSNPPHTHNCSSEFERRVWSSTNASGPAADASVLA